MTEEQKSPKYSDKRLISFTQDSVDILDFFSKKGMTATATIGMALDFFYKNHAIGATQGHSVVDDVIQVEPEGEESIQAE